MERIYNKPALIKYEGILQKNRNKRPTCDQVFLDWCKENSVKFSSYGDMGEKLGLDRRAFRRLMNDYDINLIFDPKARRTPKLYKDRNWLFHLFEMGFSSAHLTNYNPRYLRFNAEDSRELDKVILTEIPNDLDIIKYKIIENGKIRPERGIQN